MAKAESTGQMCLSFVYMSGEAQGIDKKKTTRELKGRERADSLSILEYVRGREKEKNHNKRKREERERLTRFLRKVI